MPKVTDTKSAIKAARQQVSEDKAYLRELLNQQAAEREMKREARAAERKLKAQARLETLKNKMQAIQARASGAQVVVAKTASAKRTAKSGKAKKSARATKH